MKTAVLLSLALTATVVSAAPVGVPPVKAPSLVAAKPFASTRLSVTVQGAGPDVILIHGLGGSRDVWKGTAAAVPGFRYHLVQVAGFAGAAPGGNAQGPVVAPVAAEIARYIAVRGLQRPALVGHSMGGTIATMVAARYPAAVGKLMVVDMLPQPAGLVGSSPARVRGLAEAMRNASATPGGRRLIESVIGMFGGEQARGSDTDVVARATHELALLDLTAELPRIKALTTVVYAAPDEARRAAADRLYAAAYAGKSGANLVRIDDSGHMIMYDQPAKFRAALRKFLVPS